MTTLWSESHISISVSIQVKDVLLPSPRHFDVTVKPTYLAALKVIDFAYEFILCPSFCCFLLIDQLHVVID